MKMYVTFGQSHAHRLNGQTLDCNCVAVIECLDMRDGRDKAFEYFGSKFCFTYTDDTWDESKLSYFPRGYIYC